LRDRVDILNNLSNIPVLLEDVAQKQNAIGEMPGPPANGDE
jgi:hypothetical protein